MITHFDDDEAIVSLECLNCGEPFTAQFSCDGGKVELDTCQIMCSCDFDPEDIEDRFSAILFEDARTLFFNQRSINLLYGPEPSGR